jgi:5-oxoprolinase (ATP-hydrolysing) subunit A
MFKQHINSIEPNKHGLYIDINCDMGEGMSNDAALMPYISSANISCGYHAGNEDTIKSTIELALENKVAIGAHPSYNDRENFGRLSQTISLVELAELISEQLFLFEKITTRMGCKIHHVKLHGALYNDCAKDALSSKIVAQTIQAIDPSIMLYGLSGSHTIKEASAIGLRSVQEVFADRTYQADGQLTPRYLDHALIMDPIESANQVLSMVLDQVIKTFDGTMIATNAETICIHGDHPEAVEIAKNLFNTLQQHQIEIKQP